MPLSSSSADRRIPNPQCPLLTQSGHERVHRTHTHPLLIQNGRFDEGPKSNSITAGFKFIVAREIIHLRPTAFPSRENDYARTIFIIYPAQHHRSRTRRVGSVALRAKGGRD